MIGSHCKMTQGRNQVGQTIGAEVFPHPNLTVPTCVNIALCLGEGMRKKIRGRRTEWDIGKELPYCLNLLRINWLNHWQGMDHGDECGL